MTAIATADVERTAAEVISALAGPDARVRPDQLDAVRALVVDRRRCLVVQATGWGKSAVYWIAAKALRDAGAGPVLVVSPLLALMRDQVAAAERAGLRAASLNSSNFAEWSSLEAEVLAGDVDVLLVSPERLANPRFTSDVLRHLLPRLGMLVIDEAHCISSWGHDFRPDYQRLARLLVARPDLPVLATTATANRRVSADVAAQLGDSTYVLRGQLARDSLHLSVVPGLSPLERYAWVDAALGVLEGSGIVYALTVAEAERLAGFLRERGHDVASYTGGTDPDERLALEKRLLRNEVKALVATSALGMGYDKPDLAFCVHMGSPSSPVDYYQQVGRAGRALESALVVLLPGHDDERLWEWFATASIPDPEQADAVLSALRDAGEGVATSVPALEAATGVRRGRVELLVKVLAVDGAVERVSDGWTATGHDWSYDAELYEGIKTARRAEAEIMRGYTHGRGCLEAYLRTALDDEVPEGYRCGRCSVCTGSLPGGLPSRPPDDGVLAAKAYLRGIDTIVEPRKMWAPGLARGRGRIPAALQVEAGRAVAFAGDPAWSELDALLGETAPDGDPPQWLLDAIVAVLTRWRGEWGERPEAVVPIPSRRRPRLVQGLAAHVAAVGRLPLVDALEFTGPPPSHEVAASARAVQVEESLRPLPGVVLDGPVLVVDDALRSGWTTTIAGALLREAGAGAVLPLVALRRP